MSSETAAAAIEGKQNPGPSIEESHAKLVEEGILNDDENTQGANTEANVDPEKKSEEGNADDNAPKSLEKFRREDGSIDVDALQKSYLELEKKQSGKTEENSEEETENPANENNMEVTKEPTEEEKKTVEDIAKKADVDLKELSSEWLENGELTADHYSKLEAAGYPREMVDTYAKGLTSSVTDIAGSAIEIAGGSAEYGEMLDWAIDNLSENEQQAFDAAVNSNDKATTLQAVRGLHAQYKAATDDGTREPGETLEGRKAASGDVYNHMDDYMADLNDPRYDQSESFRAKVMAKLNRSSI